MDRYILDELGLPPKRVMWCLVTGFLSVITGVTYVWLYFFSNYIYNWDAGFYTGGTFVSNQEHTLLIFFLILPTLGFVWATFSHGSKLVEHFRNRSKLLTLEKKLQLLKKELTEEELLKRPMIHQDPAKVREIIRETVNKVRDLLEEDTQKHSVSVAQLCAALDITKGPMSRRVRDALEIGYLKNLNHKGGTYELTIGEPMPKDKDTAYDLLCALFRINLTLRRWMVCSDLAQQIAEFKKKELTSEFSAKELESTLEDLLELALGDLRDRERHIEFDFYGYYEASQGLEVESRLPRSDDIDEIEKRYQKYRRAIETH